MYLIQESLGGGPHLGGIIITSSIQRDWTIPNIHYPLTPSSLGLELFPLSVCKIGEVVPFENRDVVIEYRTSLVGS